MDGESLKSVKYVVLHRQGRMKRKHIERFRLIRMTCPDLALAFDMKETFLEIIKVRDPASMKRSLEIWIDWVLDSGPNEFKKKALRFREKMDRILAWTAHPMQFGERGHQQEHPGHPQAGLRIPQSPQLFRYDPLQARGPDIQVLIPSMTSHSAAPAMALHCLQRVLEPRDMPNTG